MFRVDVGVKPGQDGKINRPSQNRLTADRRATRRDGNGQRTTLTNSSTPAADREMRPFLRNVVIDYAR